MADDLTAEALIDALRNRGDARDSTGWPDRDPDYVAEYSLTAENVPALISLAIRWIDEPSENDAVYGPVHAWRALGQLRAVEAVQPLLDVMEKLDERGDDWYLDEFHDVFGLIGTPAIEPLVTYLADDSHGEFPRGKAADGLREIARRFPETRERVVAILAAELARHQKDVGELNGFLVGNLLELKAVEAAETIERAFAVNVIDPTMAGDWGAVRQELGVPGLGIAPDQCPSWPSMRERMGLGFPAPPSERHDSAEDRKDRKRQQDAKRQAKLKRKQKKRDRKRNRKPR